MINIESTSSKLKMNNLFFRKIIFDIHDNDRFDVKNLLLDFDQSIEKQEDGNFDVTLTLKFNQKDDENLLEVICIELTGNFEIEHPDESFEKKIIENNTTAILFPYIRSQLTLLTSQPNCQPIVLPPININTLLSKKKSQR